MINLNEKTVKELRKMIKEMNIELTGAWKAKKDVLIKAIEGKLKSQNQSNESSKSPKTLKAVRVRTMESVVKDIYEMNKDELKSALNDLEKDLDEIHRYEMNGVISGKQFEEERELINSIRELVLRTIHLGPVEEVVEEVKKSKRCKKVKVTLLSGEIKIFNSVSEATKELNIKHKNAISGYWIKGKCKKAMNKSGIFEIIYI